MNDVGTTNATLILLILVMALVIGLSVVAILIILRSRKKKEEAPSILEPKPEEAPSTSLSEPLPSRRVMGQRFATAMGVLKQLVPGSNYRYRVPWFLLVGESGSGKTSILQHLSAGAADPELVSGTPAALSRRWRFLDNAILIDIPGDAFLSAQGRATDRASWTNFLRLLARHRPRRPLEGIVLTIPAGELLDAVNDAENPERLARLETIRERLCEAQRQLGLNLPIYVLITKSDQIQGFASFCGELSHEMQQDMFGWSNPHRLDTSFTGEWIDEAFDSLQDTLLHRQMEMLAGRPQLADPDGVFLFPFELQRLREPLRILLARVFRASAYNDAPFLRGVYFSGIVSPGEPASTTAPSLANNFRPAPVSASGPLGLSPVGSSFLPEFESPHLVFVQHLFDFKVFLEYRIARPIATGFFSRNRWVIAGQALALFLLVFLTASTALAYRRIHLLEQLKISRALQSVYTTVSQYNQTENKNTGTGSTDFAPAFQLMGSLNALHQNEYRTWTMPYSYMDPLRRELRQSMEAAFGKIVLQSCKRELDNRIGLMTQLPQWKDSRQRLQPGLAATPETVASAATPNAEKGTADIPIAENAVYRELGTPYTSNQHYAILQGYVGDLNRLNQNLDRYQTVSQAGTGSVPALVDLLEYLSGARLPEGKQLARDQYFQRLLTAATWVPLQIGPNYSEKTANNTLTLTQDFYRSWFGACPLYESLMMLQGELANLTSSGRQVVNIQTLNPDCQSLTLQGMDLHTLLRHIQVLDSTFSSGSYDWITEPFSRNAYPALGPELDAMRFGPVRDASVRNAVQQEGITKLAGLRATIQQQNSLLDVSSGHIRLAGSVRTLGAVLASLLQHDWMNEATAGSPGVSSNFIWKQSALTEAATLSDSYNKTMDQLLPALPRQYQTPLADIAADRVTDSLYSAVLGARVTNPDAGSPAALDTALQNFSSSVPQLQQLEQALRGMGATDKAAVVKKIVSDQANSLLVKLDAELQSVYSPKASAAAWSGNKPLSLYLYQAESPDDLAAYLKGERERIAALGSEAAPAVQFLAASKTSYAAGKQWANITSDLKQFDLAAPGNPISVLELFIQTDLDKITPDNRCKGPAGGRQSDVFLSARLRLAQTAIYECRELAVVRYNQIADFFNQRLAGHFPFSKVVITKDVPESDPTVIAQFYKLVDDESGGLTDVLPQIAADAPDAVGFLQAIGKARPFVAGGSGDPVPTVDMNVLFRADRELELNGNLIIDWQMTVGQQQIQYKSVAQKIRWHFGDPIQIVLRYAKDSPYLPAALDNSGMTVQDRTVTFDYSDSWALYSMLDSHPAPTGASPSLATFRVSNTAVSHEGVLRVTSTESTVFLRIDLSAVAAKPDAIGEKLTFAPFPAVAPKLGSQAVATGE